MNNVLKILTIIVCILFLCLFALFIYVCLALNKFNKCKSINFEEKTCEKWRYF